LACAIGSGSLHYFLGGKDLFIAVSWAEEVSDYYENPADPIVIWPGFWVIGPPIRSAKRAVGQPFRRCANLVLRDSMVSGDTYGS
jgi:hypothetical protein